MLLVLWDIDGTLVDSAGHGRHAFEDAYRAVVGRPFPGEVEMAGHTDHQIAMAMLGGEHERLPHMLEALAAGLAARKDRIREEGSPFPGAREALRALAERDDVVQSVLTGNLEANAALKLAAFGLDAFLDFMGFQFFTFQLFIAPLILVYTFSFNIIHRSGAGAG